MSEHTSESTPAESTSMTFEQMQLGAELMRALGDLGYTEPSDIQAASIPQVMAGHDLVGQAQTGTGKTAAFALPLLHHVDVNRAQCQVLILAPTRELAIQVAEAIETYGKYMRGLRVTCVYGGSSMQNQIRDIKRGAHVIVGTPGRTLDHIRRKTLKLGGVKSFVLDEADEMLRMGFIDDVERIMDATPDERQVLLFSATMPKEIRRIAQKYLSSPKEVSIKRSSATVSTITQKYWIVERGINKLSGLIRILAMQQHDGVIVFVRTRNDTDRVCESLLQRGVSASKLHGGIDQRTRQETVEQFRKGLMDVLVTTDVAARGLDVERITHVINFDPPHDSETYVHRIGRTGRAGREGTSILFLYAKERRWLRNLERDIRQRLDAMHMPTERDLEGRRIDHFKEQIHETHSSDMQPIYRHVIEDMAQSYDLDPLDCAAALLKMVTAPMGLVDPGNIYGDPRRDPPTTHRDDRRDNDRQDHHKEDRRDDSRDDSRSQRRETRDEPAHDAPAPNLASTPDMDLFRIDLTRADGITPRRIIGALMTDVGLPREAVGKIDFYQEYTTVELVKGLPPELLHDLESLEVAHLPIGMKLMTERPTSRPLVSGGPKPHNLRRGKTGSKKPRHKKRTSTSSKKRSFTK